jgi:hypothetical protein
MHIYCLPTSIMQVIPRIPFLLGFQNLDIETTMTQRDLICAVSSQWEARQCAIKLDRRQVTRRESSPDMTPTRQRLTLSLSQAKEQETSQPLGFSILPTHSF